MIDKLTEMKNQIAEVLMSTKSFNEDFRSHVKAVRSSVEEGRESGHPIKSFLPRLIVSSLDADNPGQRKLAVIGLTEFPQTNAEKRQLMAQLGIACAANDLQVVMVVFESEAWTAEEKRDPKEIPAKDFVPPSERPDRKEIIMVAARSIDGRDAFASIPITGRHEDESLILGEEIIQEFEEKREMVVKDSLLGTFFEALVMAAFSKVEAETLMAQGKEVPEAVQQMVLLMDSCPLKLK